MSLLQLQHLSEPKRFLITRVHLQSYRNAKEIKGELGDAVQFIVVIHRRRVQVNQCKNIKKSRYRGKTTEGPHPQDIRIRIMNLTNTQDDLVGLYSCRVRIGSAHRCTSYESSSSFILFMVFLLTNDLGISRYLVHFQIHLIRLE